MFTKTDIEKYFIAEKQESLLFLVIGIVAVVGALIFFFALRTHFFKGLAIPLFFIGTLLAIVGYTVYKRSDKDRIRNVYAYDMNPSELKEKELPRMKTVMKNFTIYRYTEIALFILGAGLYFYFSRYPGKELLRGLGLGLMIMALLALFADYFAEKRGKTYTKGIESFVNK